MAAQTIGCYQKQFEKIIIDSLCSAMNEGDCIKMVHFVLKKQDPNIESLPPHECFHCKAETDVIHYFTPHYDKEVMIRHINIWINAFRRFLKPSIAHDGSHAIIDRSKRSHFLAYRDKLFMLLLEDNCERAELFQKRYGCLTDTRMNPMTFYMNYYIYMAMTEEEFDEFSGRNFMFACYSDSEIDELNKTPEMILAEMTKEHEKCCGFDFSEKHAYAKLIALKEKIEKETEHLLPE